jgi:hypothetical protein
MGLTEANMRGRIGVISWVLVAATAMAGACSSTGSTLSSPSGAPSAGVSATPSAKVETAEELLARCEAALKAAPSFRMKSTATVGDIVQVTEAIHVGDNVKGTQVVQGLKTQFIRVGKDLYINGSEAYWSNKVNLEGLSKVIYKWVKVDASDPSHAPLAQPFDESATFTGTLSRDGTSTIGGKPVFVIKSSADAVLYVAAGGEPYPLKIEATQSVAAATAHVVVEFSDFGTITTTIAAPSGPILTMTKS